MTQMQKVHLVFPGNQMAVRKALKSCMEELTRLDLNADDKASVELVLAEVLNNVVEHAYQERDIGVIELDARREGEELFVSIQDEGLPMPQGELPQGLPHDLDSLGDQDLPEGGFGWFLIRELTRDLTYRRDGCRNRLSFRMGLNKECLPN